MPGAVATPRPGGAGQAAVTAALRTACQAHLGGAVNSVTLKERAEVVDAPDSFSSSPLPSL